jgi:hypothetical protein
MMRRLGILLALTIALAFSIFASTAGATIHPLVESFDCANAAAFANTPNNDPAEVPGQITSGFAALSNASDAAYQSFKLNGACGANNH